MDIIAEIGKNFVVTEKEETLDVLLERVKFLISKAKHAGATAVKFQVHNYQDEILEKTKINSPHFQHDRFAWVKRNTYPVEFWMQIADYCRVANIEFLATPMSRGAAILIDTMGVDRWKVGSGDLNDYVLLDYIRDTNKPVILSSGMSSLEELKNAYDFLAEKTQNISILHCVSLYPCPREKLNLNTIPFLKKQFRDATIGFSDHSLEITSGLAAVSLGAEIIEKHFTLDRNAWGPDHKVSLEPEEFTQMVKEIKNYKKYNLPKEMLGVETKYIQEGEEPFRAVFKKGLYTTREIKEGEIWEPDMICALRANEGALSPIYYPNILRMKAIKDYKPYEKIS